MAGPAPTPKRQRSDEPTEDTFHGMAAPFNDEANLKDETTASFRLNHQWIVEVLDGYLCGLCHDTSHIEKLKLCTGKKYFVDKVCVKKQQPGRKALAHEKDSRHIHLTSTNINIGAYIIEATEKLAKQKSAGKEKYILKYLDQAYFLFKEQIPHTTKFEKLVSLTCRMSEDIDSWTKNRDHNATYRSKASVTEFLELFEKQICEDTNADLSASLDIYRSWTLLADETSVHNHGILSIYARYISYKTGIVEECMLDCKPIEGRTTAENLFKLIDESIEKVGIDKYLCRSVSFDGARNMSSEQEGVLGYLKRFWNQNILFEHCRAHRLALVCKTVANEVPLVKEVIELINAIYKVFQKSNRKVDLLKAKCLEDEMKVKTLIKAAITRWLTTGQSVDRLIELIVQVVESLQDISDDNSFDHEDRLKYKGLFSSLLSSRSLKVLLMLQMVLGHANRLSSIFQDPKVGYSYALSETKAFVILLKDLDVSIFINKPFETLSKRISTAGFEISERGPLRSNRLKVHPIDSILGDYISGLIREMNARFSEDSSDLSNLARFDSEHWMKTGSAILWVTRRFGFNKCALDGEIYTLTKFIEAEKLFEGCDTQEDAYKRFLANATLRAVYPEHTMVATFFLCRPMGTASVERSFSSTTKIVSDDRCSLTPAHIGMLTRISVQGVALPGIHDNSKAYLEFLQRVFLQWAKSPRRIDQ